MAFFHRVCQESGLQFGFPGSIREKLLKSPGAEGRIRPRWACVTDVTAVRWQLMVDPVQTSNNSAGEKGDGAVAAYVDSLSQEHRMLVVLKAQLYGGSWDPMLDDLRNRLTGKPYIFKLVHRIQDDIERIEQMRRFEAEHGVNLTDYVDLA